jgi:hypothetical protein
VLLEHLTKIHPIELIAAENDEVLVRILQEIAQVLPNRVSRTLVPVRVRGRLLSGKDLDEAPREIVELVARIDVLVQRRRVELRQDVDPPQPELMQFEIGMSTIRYFPRAEQQVSNAPSSVETAASPRHLP